MPEVNAEPQTTRVYDRPAIRGLGDAIVQDRDATSPVSYLEAAGAVPPNMRLGWAAMGVMGFPMAMTHDKIVGEAEQTLAGTIEALHGHRDSLHAVAANVESAEKESIENVRRI